MKGKPDPMRPDLIHCDTCGRELVSASGHFLRPVLLLCRDCNMRTKSYPRPDENESIDRLTQSGVDSRRPKS
jgi:ribosomal protein S27E